MGPWLLPLLFGTLVSQLVGSAIWKCIASATWNLDCLSHTYLYHYVAFTMFISFKQI